MPNHAIAAIATGLPSAFDVPLSPSMRARIEEAIELLIAVLDRDDGDCDIEQDDPAELNGDESDINECWTVN